MDDTTLRAWPARNLVRTAVVGGCSAALVRTDRRDELRLVGVKAPTPEAARTNARNRGSVTLPPLRRTTAGALAPVTLRT